MFTDGIRPRLRIRKVNPELIASSSPEGKLLPPKIAKRKSAEKTVISVTRSVSLVLE